MNEVPFFGTGGTNNSPRAIALTRRERKAEKIGDAF